MSDVCGNHCLVVAGGGERLSKVQICMRLFVAGVLFVSAEAI